MADRLQSRLFVPIASLALLGVGVDAYLTAAHFGGGVACFGQGGCDLVAASSYARVLGIPVALLGALTFAAIAVVALVAARPAAARTARSALAVFGLAITGAAYSVYLSLVAALVLRAACAWCLTSAALMLSLLGLAIVAVRR